MICLKILYTILHNTYQELRTKGFPIHPDIQSSAVAYQPHPSLIQKSMIFRPETTGYHAYGTDWQVMAHFMAIWMSARARIGTIGSYIFVHLQLQYLPLYILLQTKVIILPTHEYKKAYTNLQANPADRNYPVLKYSYEAKHSQKTFECPARH